MTTISGDPDTTRGGRTGPGDATGSAVDWTADARYFEYTAAADPIRSGHTPPVPLMSFPRSLYDGDATRVVPLDLSAALGITSGPATSPGLLASFVRIAPGDEITTDANATSQLFYVIEGSGTTTDGSGRTIPWTDGDVVTLPSGAGYAGGATHAATERTALYWVHDEPLLRHLGVRACEPRFAATLFPGADARAALESVAAAPGANRNNRVSVLLANANQEQTLTITHVLWAMYGLLPVGQVQRPHRHQSVALDLILDFRPGCYTLVGGRIDERGDIVDPRRVDWEPGGAFITPPGLWHAHVNQSGAPAHLLPVQDAGLQTYLRSLDIRFAPSV